MNTYFHSALGTYQQRQWSDERYAHFEEDGDFPSYHELQVLIQTFESWKTK